MNPVSDDSRERPGDEHVGLRLPGRHADDVTMSEPSQGEGRGPVTSNIRLYIMDINALTESYQTGAKYKLEVVSAVTQILNDDANLSPQTRTQSFEVFLAEVKATKGK